MSFDFLDPLGLFSKPKMPDIAPAPPAPALSDKATQAAAEEERRRRAGRGRASTILSGSQGIEEDKPGARTLLGAGY